MIDVEVSTCCNMCVNAIAWAAHFMAIPFSRRVCAFAEAKETEGR